MQLSLDVDMLPEIRFLRHPQTDIIGSFANNRLLEKDFDSLNHALEEVATLSTIRSFGFHSLSGKEAITSPMAVLLTSTKCYTSFKH